MVGLDNIDPQRRHWYSEEHFARQLGNPAARAVVEGRWRLLEAEVKRWLERDRPAQASSSAPLRILDAGCGDGINLLALSRIFADLRRPIRLQGIDYNDLRIERAKALGLDCELGVGSLADTGLAAASVDEPDAVGGEIEFVAVTMHGFGCDSQDDRLASSRADFDRGFIIG